jgi:hypothetical protein
LEEIVRSIVRRARRAMLALAGTAALSLGQPSVAWAAGTAPNPGNTQPPGTAGLLTMLSWASWIVSFLCVVGVLLVAGTMAVRHHRGEGGEALGRLGWVLGACVLGSGAGAIAGALI